MDLLELAARQHSAFSLAQAVELGISPRRVHRMVERRDVERVAPSVFRLRGVGATWHQRLMVATLSIPGSMASHRSAARLRVLDGFSRAPVEIAVVRGRGERAFRWERERRRRLTALGWTVLEYTYREVVDRGAMVIHELGRELGRPAA